MTAATRTGGAGRGVWIGGLLIVAGLVAVLVLTSRQSAGTPFDASSSAPDGYRALAILLRERGAEVRTTTAARAAEDPPSAGQVLVVPAPELLTAPERRAFREAAEAGAVVATGGPLVEDDAFEDGFGDLFFPYDARTLADTPAVPTGQGDCDVDRLVGLGPIDTAFSDPASVRSAGAEARRCYGDLTGAYVVEERVGEGSITTLGSAYLWANARLQPAKEEGGEPLDNAVVALRLLGPTADGATTGTSITFVDAVPTAGVSPDGTQNPIDLLPTGVKLALVQLLAAFVIYAWWRARRLGPVVVERMPVEIAGSELVVAVGDLLRRKGTPQRAADVLRADARRELSARLGVPPGAPPGALVQVVAQRSGRDADALSAALLDGPVDSAEALVRLADSLSDIRQEVLQHHVVT
ncbi:DUF4350 domain-containing protein [Dermatobacter hominis]|uniref:DUF4350 domain-containing protein n=1 Tax=Dermatobacter hominis TaxID=2884263 RepID=UPI001D109F63|nr:DUF4350 domain-containing protein [Dermatobacter hominis]UDY37141.1 DUF4350 domain-containing protein [Dermatobacter hominis]